MKSGDMERCENFAEMFVDVKRSVPYYHKYGLALSVAASHTRPEDLCVINLSRLLHVCSLLNSLTGTTRYFKPLMQSMVVKGISDLNPTVLKGIADSATYEVSNNFTTRYEEVVSVISRSALRGLQSREDINKVKRIFIKALGHNNCALFFNQQIGADRPFPKKFETFKAAINTFILGGEVLSTEYYKTLGISNIAIPLMSTLEYKAVLLDTKALVVGSADHTHTLLLCERTGDYYALVPSLNLFSMLALAVPVEANEVELGSAKMRQSLNTVINEAIQTNSNDASTAYQAAATTKKFRRLK